MRTLNLLVIADHESKYLWDFFDREKLNDVEMIVSCGDLDSEFLSFLVTMLPVPLLYVCGNHDTRYLENPPEGCIDLEANGIFTYKGIRFLGYGGCQSASGKPFQYTEKEMCAHVRRDSTARHLANGFDVLVTHAAAKGLGDGEDSFHQGFQCFRDIIERWQPAYHFHGHDHLSYHYATPRQMTCGETQIINAYGYYRLRLELPDVKRRGISRLIRL